MRYKTFGTLRLPAIGQGAGGADGASDAVWIGVLQAGIDLGMTLIDTAEIYRAGRSEKVVGKAVEGRRDKVFISTKFSPDHCRSQEVKKALEGSLRRLKTDHVDLYQIHWPSPSVTLDETVGAMLELKAAGKVRFLGVSNFTVEDMMKARALSGDQIVSNQIEYNLVDRGPEKDLLPYCSQHGCFLVAYNPLLAGAVRRPLLKSIAQRHGKTAVQVILRWLAGHDCVIPIPKTLNISHVRDNATAVDFDLDEQALGEIEEAFAYRVIRAPARQIRILPSSTEVIYTSRREAEENKAGAIPSPVELADGIRSHGMLKPVRLVPTTDQSGRYLYDLTQGRMRYWAWVIAHGEDSEVPAYVME
ncbi:MAG TPA: aldo/keto reductase [Kiritimatiellia bacterium]|nr:aldo/keto reductase [Kiritimatiellia bacterium]